MEKEPHADTTLNLQTDRSEVMTVELVSPPDRRDLPTCASSRPELSLRFDMVSVVAVVAVVAVVVVAAVAVAFELNVVVAVVVVVAAAAG